MGDEQSRRLDQRDSRRDSRRDDEVSRREDEHSRRSDRKDDEESRRIRRETETRRDQDNERRLEDSNHREVQDIRAGLDEMSNEKLRKNIDGDWLSFSTKPYKMIDGNEFLPQFLIGGIAVAMMLKNQAKVA